MVVRKLVGFEHGQITLEEEDGNPDKVLVFAVSLEDQRFIEQEAKKLGLNLDSPEGWMKRGEELEHALLQEQMKQEKRNAEIAEVYFQQRNRYFLAELQALQKLHAKEQTPEATALLKNAVRAGPKRLSFLELPFNYPLKTNRAAYAGKLKIEQIIDENHMLVKLGMQRVLAAGWKTSESEVGQAFEPDEAIVVLGNTSFMAGNGAKAIELTVIAPFDPDQDAAKYAPEISLEVREIVGESENLPE